MRYITATLLLLTSLLLADYQRFTRLDTGIVTDHEYGLQWQDDTNHTDEWLGAIDYCENLTLGGYDDWRMPNINELSFIIDTERIPTISPVFTNIKNNTTSCTDGQSAYWSSTSRISDTNLSITIRFEDGMHKGLKKKQYTNSSDEKRDENCSIRCVRSDFD